MKKLLLSGAALLLFGLTGAKAQTTVFSENFNAFPETVPMFVLDADGDEISWLFTSGTTWAADYNIDGGFAVSFSYDDTNEIVLTPENYIGFEEPIEIPANAVNTLNIKLATWSAEFPTENVFVYMPNAEAFDAAAEAATSMEEIYAAMGEPVFHTILQAEHEQATVFTQDLAGLAGQTVYMFIRHGETEDLFLENYGVVLDEVSITSTPSAGVNDLAKDMVSVFPNPAKDVVNISTAADLTIKSVEVRDINGRTVKSVNTANTVNVSDLASGVYTMTIATDKGSSVKKFIKE